MKVTWCVNKAIIEAEGKDVKDVFAQLGAASEVFSQSQCKACGSNNVIPNVRHNQDFDFMEMQCIDCGCRLQFGTRKADGALYPRRRDQDGNELGVGGWSKWQPREEFHPRQEQRGGRQPARQAPTHMVENDPDEEMPF